MFCFRLLVLALGLLSARLACARNATALLITLDVVGPAVEARFPPSLRNSEVPIAVLNALLNSIMDYNVFAVCDPNRVALNFWGEEQRLPVEVCMDPESIPLIGAYSFLRVAEVYFPDPAALYSDLMKESGFDPEDRSMDAETAVGVGNAMGVRLLDFVYGSGWNAGGEWAVAKKDRKQFMDYSDYRPANSPWELQRPLRWQPMVGSDKTTGRFNYQRHVVPFLGWVRPMLLTREELVGRYVDPPYKNMDASTISGEDVKTMDRLVRDVMNVSANLTPEQRYQAKWWDNKLGSVGLIGPFYAVNLGFDLAFGARWYLGEMLAQYDAIILAWKEKRRTDAVRPATIVNNLYAEETFDAYVTQDKGVKSIFGKDWESLIPSQPHSEFPSGSAAICTSFAEHAEIMLNEYKKTKGLTEILPYRFDFFTDFIPIDSEGAPPISYKTPTEAAKICGISRVWAGVHFPPAVEAGEKLVAGLGEKAYYMVKDLFEGRIPANCWWCSANDDTSDQGLHV